MNRHERRKQAAIQRTEGRAPAPPVIRSKSGASIPVPPVVMQAMQRQGEAFRAKFNRDPRPDDPLFFDPLAPGPNPVALSPAETVRRLVSHLREGGVREHIVRAFQKTGRLVTAESVKLISPAEEAEWRKAIEESIVQLRIERGAYDPETGT